MRKGFGLSAENLRKLHAMQVSETTSLSTPKNTSLEKKPAHALPNYPRILENQEGKLPELLTYQGQVYKLDPYRKYFRPPTQNAEESPEEIEVQKYEYVRGKNTIPGEQVPLSMYVTHTGELVYSRGLTANPLQHDFKNLKDPAPPILGELRTDNEGIAWRYESRYSAREYFSHHDFDLSCGPGWDFRWGLNKLSPEQMKLKFGKIVAFSDENITNPRTIPADILYYSWEYARDANK